MSEVMSLEEARGILGDEAKGISDEHLEELITDFEHLASIVIRNFTVLKNKSAQTLNLV